MTTSAPSESGHLDAPEKDASLPKKIRDPQTIAMLKRHFWCDFSDIFPHMQWDEPTQPN